MWRLPMSICARRSSGFALAEADVANATEGVRIATGRYSTGLGLFLDIITAQAFLLTARTNLVNTQNAVEQYRATLNHALGAPIPAVRIVRR